MAMGNYAKLATINFWARNQPVPQPALVYVALYTTNPTGADTGIEASGGGYERQQATFGTPTISGDSAIASNSALITFPTLTAGAGTATYVALKDAQTGGNLIAYAPLATALPLNTGFRPIFPVGNLRFIVT